MSNSVLRQNQMRLVGQKSGEETWREDGPLSESEMKRGGRRMAGRHGGREVGEEERMEGRRTEKEERHLGACHPYPLLSKTQAGRHSIKAITLALLAVLEIKFGLLKLYTKKPVG